MSTLTAKPIHIHRFADTLGDEEYDVVATEEPLEIRLVFGSEHERTLRSLAVTMRTPGNDFELALGFLFTEGIISGMDEVMQIRHCHNKDGELSENIVLVELQPTVFIDWERFQRNFYTHSSCGVCGKTSLESLNIRCASLAENRLRVSGNIIQGLGKTLHSVQAIFQHTGGLHAASIFDPDGTIRLVREDVGRHNALDKVIGAFLFEKMLPLHESMLLLSGRSSFELIQKAISAGIPIVVSVGAPSSLAVEAAREFGITLVGFAKPNSFNIYSHEERIL